MVKVMYNDQLVYKVVISAFLGISLYTEKVDNIYWSWNFKLLCAPKWLLVDRNHMPSLQPSLLSLYPWLNGAMPMYYDIMCSRGTRSSEYGTEAKRNWKWSTVQEFGARMVDKRYTILALE